MDEWNKNSNIPLFRFLEKFFYPFLHPVSHFAKDIPFPFLESTLCHVSASIENQSHSGCVHGTVDQIDQTTDADRDSPPNRHIKDLLGQISNSFEERAAPRENNSGSEQISITRLHDFLVHQTEDFLDPRFNDLCQGISGEGSWLPSSPTGNFDGLILANQRGQGASASYLDLLRLLQGCPESQ